MDYCSNDCPCGSTMSPVIYGIPTAEMIELARQDMIALGGTNTKLPMASHYCYSCGNVKYITY
jgi:hypothetical protein